MQPYRYTDGDAVRGRIEPNGATRRIRRRQRVRGGKRGPGYDGPAALVSPTVGKKQINLRRPQITDLAERERRRLRATGNLDAER